MAGTGPSGRKYLFEWPSQEEVECVLWRMIFGACQREDELRREKKERGEEWLRRERCLREWEDDLEIREGKVGGIDRGLEKMMKELRIRKNEVLTKDIEIKDLKQELEDKVRRAREDLAREMKVLYVCCVCCVLFGVIIIKEYDKMYGTAKGGYDQG